MLSLYQTHQPAIEGSLCPDIYSILSIWLAIKQDNSVLRFVRGNWLKKTKNTERDGRTDYKRVHWGHYLQYVGVGKALQLGLLWWMINCLRSSLFNQLPWRATERECCKTCSKQTLTMPRTPICFCLGQFNKVLVLTLRHLCCLVSGITVYLEYKKKKTCSLVLSDVNTLERGCSCVWEKAATSLLVPWETGMVSSSPLPFPPSSSCCFSPCLWRRRRVSKEEAGHDSRGCGSGTQTAGKA